MSADNKDMTSETPKMNRKDKSWNYVIVSNHAQILRDGSFTPDDGTGSPCYCEACRAHRDGTPITLERINELRG